MQNQFRHTLATAVTLVALATTACGSSSADTPGPIPSPVTAGSVRAAIDSSTMKSGHFKLKGTMIKQPGYYPVSGSGVLQRLPREALQMTLLIQTYGPQGVLRIQSVTVAGTRVGSGRWTSKASTDSMLTLSSYVGEETVAGSAVWHARSLVTGTTYDIWVRESDGYPVQLGLSSATGGFTLTFDYYNKTSAIARPTN